MALALAIAGLAGAVLLIRLGWGGRRNLAVAGWALAGAALAWLTWSEGAWGLATGLTAGSVFAVAIVLHAAAVSPRRRLQRAASRAPSPRTSEPKAIGRRLLVFLPVVPLSFLAAQALAFAVNAAMKGDGPLDANSVSAMLFVQPIAWAILMAWQMVLPGARQMLVPPALAAGAAVLIGILA